MLVDFTIKYKKVDGVLNIPFIDSMGSTKWVIVIIAVIIVVGLLIWYYSRYALPAAPTGGPVGPGQVVGPTGKASVPPPGVPVAPSR